MNKNQSIIIVLMSIILVVLIVVMFFVMRPQMLLSKKYDQAQEVFSSGDYDNALILYEEIKDYKDSNEMVLECKYRIAYAILYGNIENEHKLVNEYGFISYGEDFNKAIILLDEIDNYKDSAEHSVKVKQYFEFQNAIELFESGDFDSALTIFNSFDIGYANVGRYIAGIKKIGLVAGEWEGESMDGMLITANFAISPPYKITFSPYSDCQWMVGASIEEDITLYGARSIDYRKSIIEEGYHYKEDDIIVENDIMYKVKDGYPNRLIIIKYNANDDTITLKEFKIVGDSIYYADAIDIILYRVNN